MLEIKIPASEVYNNEKEEFFSTKEQTLCLEHSLVSISKWESIWCKPFLSQKKKTEDEILSYIKCMTITKNVEDSLYQLIPSNVFSEIQKYIDAPMTATTFSNEHPKSSREIVTSELIYYWMVAYNIPFECQKWHLNRLLTLIHVCSIKNSPPKKMSKSAILNRNKSLNAARRAAAHTKG